ncbi:hypothetical protein ES708_30536 [subsurface metagenome]
MSAGNFNVKTVVADRGPDLIPGPTGCKDSISADYRYFTLQGQAGSYGCHILLGNTYTDHPFLSLRMLLFKTGNLYRAGDISMHRYNTRVITDLVQTLAKTEPGGLHFHSHTITPVPPVISFMLGKLQGKLLFLFLLVFAGRGKELLNPLTAKIGAADILDGFCKLFPGFSGNPVPAGNILHKRDVFTLYGIGNDYCRSSLYSPGPGKSFEDRSHIVAVDLNDLPSESLILLI